jgi:hypothetical protein
MIFTPKHGGPIIQLEDIPGGIQTPRPSGVCKPRKIHNGMTGARGLVTPLDTNDLSYAKRHEKAVMGAARR